MPAEANVWLLSGAALNVAVALLHVGCIVFGASWYRFFGAGERMARMAESGDWRAASITSAIVLALATWALYAFSGAGMAGPLPLRRAVLCAIAAIYVVRALGGFAVAFAGRAPNPRFWWWSSLICLVFGIIHLVGVTRGWAQL